jgi:hypothetical protein
MCSNNVRKAPLHVEEEEEEDESEEDESGIPIPHVSSSPPSIGHIGPSPRVM